jgi:Glycosyltransferase Family 4
MPKLLIISSTFPPFSNVGAVRLGCFAKYLTRAGWEVISVTLKHNSQRDDDSMVVNMPDIPNEYYHDSMGDNLFGRLFHKVGRKFRFEYLSYGLYPFTGYSDGKRAISAIMAMHDVDIVLTSFVRPLALRLASWTHVKYGIPWVADFRDTIEMIDFKWKERIMFWTEQRVIASASRLVTTSPSLVRQLQSRHDQPVSIIENGFDPEDYDNPTPTKWDRFTILYTGSLLPGRSPLLFYHALDELLDEELIKPDEVQVVHYGVTNFRVDGNFLSGLMRQIKHREVLVFQDRVSRQQSIKSQIGADLLLLLPGLVSKHGGNIPAKLYEYLRSNRPIISVASSSQEEVAGIISRCNAGLATSDLGEIKQFVYSQFQVWKQKDSAQTPQNLDDLEPYSRAYQSGLMGNLLQEVLSEKN